MKRRFAAAVWAVCLGVAGCSPIQLFPSDVTVGVDANFDFSKWRMMPNQALDRKIQLGGSIIQSVQGQGTTTLVVMHLPIVEHPAYGPKDIGKRSGEFAVTYVGRVDSPFLQRGNRLIIVGTTKPAKVISVDDLPRSLPVLSAECLHIWNTGGRDIADFPSYGAGYETLEEETFCTTTR
jgi:starvation-inducible outer membrane lipoprotein